LLSSGLETRPNEEVHNEWSQFHRQSDTTLFPFAGISFLKRKIRIDLSCFVSLASLIPTVLFVWHFQQSEKNEVFFLGWLLIIKMSICLSA
jgi:hypothetical protein